MSLVEKISDILLKQEDPLHAYVELFYGLLAESTRFVRNDHGLSESAVQDLHSNICRVLVYCEDEDSGSIELFYNLLTHFTTHTKQHLENRKYLSSLLEDTQDDTVNLRGDIIWSSIIEDFNLDLSKLNERTKLLMIGFFCMHTFLVNKETNGDLADTSRDTGLIAAISDMYPSADSWNQRRAEGLLFSALADEVDLDTPC